MNIDIKFGQQTLSLGEDSIDECSLSYIGYVISTMPRSKSMYLHLLLFTISLFKVDKTLYMYIYIYRYISSFYAFIIKCYGMILTY